MGTEVSVFSHYIGAEYYSHQTSVCIPQEVNGGDVCCHAAQVLRSLDIFFTTIFAMEVVVNAFSFWFIPFVSNRW
jgi:hypothetical protein